MSTYEGTGVEYGSFLYFNNSGERCEYPVSGLFEDVGSGILLEGSLELEEDIEADETQASAHEKPKSFTLGPIRKIAERLEILAYEVNNGQVEFRIIYFELGGVIDIMLSLFNIALSEADDGYMDISEIKSSFKNFLSMCKRYRRTMEKLPDTKLVRFD
ncbi:hypothetical protein [Vacuolonema iberomarrocanum]|uniref:hypothetical protein n=1 Tax=Vacuolonema iberomarrocanum TaxID=3454632 RepID=UPI0019EF4369|nr:hypothetical protein [filamentous cyanobacterium LEGE 07170]